MGGAEDSHSEMLTAYFDLLEYVRDCIQWYRLGCYTAPHERDPSDKAGGSITERITITTSHKISTRGAERQEKSQTL